MTIDELKHLKESEDKVEFKAAEHNFPFAGGSHTSQDERRKCFLGYIVAFANEGGGKLVLGMAITDLDEAALRTMKEKYARKQNNPGFMQLSNEQVLSDLKLFCKDKLNYAALILLGTKEILQQCLPQCKTVWEFRNSDSQIHHDERTTVETPLYIAINEIWQLINQPTLNKKHPVQSGAYIFDLYDFNEGVIREAVLNAIAHRDYTISSEVVIKQYPNKIIINNPGGFPKGVTLENILTVSSTPRSRLMTEILEKTGLVERSGQGVDKIYSITLSEGKPEPDYTKSDVFQVSLCIQTEITDKAFHVFISQYQNSDKEPKLGVEQIITLSKIKDGHFQKLNLNIVSQLENIRLIQKVSGHTNRYTLAGEYHQLLNESLKIGKRYIVKEVVQMLLALQGNQLKMGELEAVLKDLLNRNQVKYLTGKLVEDKILKKNGKGSGMTYAVNPFYHNFRGNDLTRRAISDLRNNYEKSNSPKYNKNSPK